MALRGIVVGLAVAGGISCKQTVPSPQPTAPKESAVRCLAARLPTPRLEVITPAATEQPSAPPAASSSAPADEAANAGGAQPAIPEAAGAAASPAAASGDEAQPMPSNACVARARSITQSLTPRQKFAQMMQPDRSQVGPAPEAGKHGFGSILSGGGSSPTENTPLAWARMVNSYRTETLEAPPHLPMLYGIDAVHGHNNVRGAVIFPHNIGLGATRNPDLVERIGRATAAAVAGTNIDWTFAPVLAAAKDERWGRTYEAYGETAELAELLGPALIRGLQGPRLGGSPTSVLACAKHYIGDGDTFGGKDQGDVKMTPEELMKELLPAYRLAIEAGVGSIMASYSSIEGAKMHCNGPLLNDVLKTELGFRGFVVSDWGATEQLPGSYGDQLTAAVNGGVDMIMAPKQHTGFIDEMERLVPARIPAERVDDAVERIIAIKCELGLLEPNRFQRDRSGELSINDSISTMGSDEHRTLAREAVRQSLVLLKNESSALPLTSALGHIHVAGTHGDDVGLQSGGWTISWQGSKGPITPGTTILGALRSALPQTEISFSKDAPNAQAPDANVLVIGELPYAEGSGDTAKLTATPEQLALAEKLHAQGKPLIVLLVSGRPLILGPLLEMADALVALWLPGTEGAGVVDVITGQSDFVGKLSHSWPTNLEQIPINVGDSPYNPLFPYGFGLTYAKGSAGATLNDSTNPVSP